MLSETEIRTKAEQLRNLLREALAALEDPLVLADLVAFAQDNPMFAWEPVALANFALHSRRDAAASGSSGPKVLLPTDPAASGSVPGRAGLSLPHPPPGF